MKILLSWIVDYLDCSIAKIDVKNLVHKFNIRTAEIESYQPVHVDLQSMVVVRLDAVSEISSECFCPELKKSITLPSRSDAVIGKFYLALQKDENFRWALVSDFNAEKEGIMPAVMATDVDQKGAWRTKLSQHDYVFDVDNKSINHRPDLWGHYGIAREIAAYLDIPLKSLESGLSKQDVVTSGSVSKNGLSVTIKNTQACFNFAGLLCDSVAYQDSDIVMAIRLALVGIKPMNAVVDLTNYVMLDIGHPMHVFDAAAFADRSMIVRAAQANEKLELLDGQKVTLTQHDVVVAGSEQVESLAGIMGGKDSAYQPSTKSIILEAAGFDPVVIRKTAQRLKLRTEASMRFEKDLDPYQNVTVLQRFLFLAHQLGVLSGKITYPIVVAGKVYQEKTCTVVHDFIQTRLGMQIDPQMVQKLLEKHGFIVEYTKNDQVYHVTIPSHRATKDINIAEDIVEEVIRSYGFENIVPQLPMRATVPFAVNTMNNIRTIKRQLAYGLGMHEVRDYMMYDASWIAQVKVDMHNAVRVKSPLSENWTTLVTSLIPHLVKSVDANKAQRDQLRFFEYGRTWTKTAASTYQENVVLAGIMYDKQSIDFYSCKQELQQLWDSLGIVAEYRKPMSAVPAWYDQYQTAELVVDGKLIGLAGVVSAAWKHQVLEGSAFIFEFDGLLLENLKIKTHKFKPWSKFQDVTYDISLFIPLSVTSDKVCSLIQKAHPDIVDVSVVDFFEKPEWIDHRAVTVRYRMSNAEKTMTKHDLDVIVQSVHQALKELHVQIR